MTLSTITMNVLHQRLLGTAASSEANGSGWSSTYDCLLHTGSVDSLSENWCSSCPSLHNLNHGFILSLHSFHTLNPVYLNDSFILKSIHFALYLPPAHLSSLQNVSSVVDYVLAKFDIPTTDPDSLIQPIYSFGRRNEESSTTMLVPLYINFNAATVLRDEAEAADWLYKGTPDSVIVKSLRATRREIIKLKKRNFDGSTSKAETCVICLERFEDGERVSELRCLHEYHYDCIAVWLRSNHRCPICRFQVPWVHSILPEDDDV